MSRSAHQLAAGASTADGIIRLTLSQQHIADGELVIIPEPECPAGGSGLQIVTVVTSAVRITWDKRGDTDSGLPVRPMYPATG